MRLPVPKRSPRNSLRRSAHCRTVAFSLVELLVAIAVVAVLSVMGVSIYGCISRKTALVREISAGKTLIASYHAYSVDHGGALLPGFDERASLLHLPNGTPVDAAETARYPYRLGQYFDYRMEGVVWVNRNRLQIEEVFKGKMSNPEVYGASLFPAFGINYLYVGGNYVAGGPQVELMIPDEVEKRQGSGAPLVVFASAGSKTGSTKVDGYHVIKPPYRAAMDTDNWGDSAAAWSTHSSPASYGNIDFRHEGRAACVFLDGSVRTMTPEELSDMRLWNKNAWAANNSDYRVTPPQTGGGRPR